jgi:hypothetical protein
LRGAGEGAALVAEQLGLEKLFGQRRAVERDERSLAARRRAVQEARDDLLAGARLAEQQRGGVGGRDLRGLRQHLLPRRDWPMTRR